MPLLKPREPCGKYAMKLKYILNTILFVLALSSLFMCIFKTTELSLKCMQFAVSISCIGVMFSRKNIDTYLHLSL